MMRSLALAIALACGGAFALPAFAQSSASATAADQQSPVQVVQTVVDDLDKAIAGHQQELKNNHNKIASIIDQIFLPRFDIDYAAILVLGQHAREATPEQRSRFAKAFYNSITHRYAESLLDYTRGRVKVLPFNGDLNARRTIVRSQVLTDDGKTIAVDYAFRKDSNGNWKAYDVLVEGISYITNYRNQVDSEIRKNGLDNLIANLETQGDKTLENMEQNDKASSK